MLSSQLGCDIEFSKDLTKQKIIEMRQQALEYKNSRDKSYHSILKSVFQELVQDFNASAIIDVCNININHFSWVVQKLREDGWVLKIYEACTSTCKIVEIENIDNQYSKSQCIVIADKTEDINVEDVYKRWDGVEDFYH